MNSVCGLITTIFAAMTASIGDKLVRDSLEENYKLFQRISFANNWSPRQLDFNNAFLNCELHKFVFMEQPPGFIEDNKAHLVYRLNKAFCGLKQAPRAWFEKLGFALTSHGFKQPTQIIHYS